MPRLFVALPVPADVAAALATLRADVPGARWTPEHQMHLTLRFIGEVGDAERVRWALSEWSFRWVAPRVRLIARGAFGRARPAPVLVALAEPEPGLTALQRAVSEALYVRTSVPADRRPYKPHVTLARLRGTPATEVEAWAGGPMPPDLAFESAEFVLYESRLGPSGAVHVPLARYDATGPGRL